MSEPRKEMPPWQRQAIADGAYRLLEIGMVPKGEAAGAMALTAAAIDGAYEAMEAAMAGGILNTLTNGTGRLKLPAELPPFMAYLVLQEVRRWLTEELMPSTAALPPEQIISSL